MIAMIAFYCYSFERRDYLDYKEGKKYIWVSEIQTRSFCLQIQN
jgi:hypothetical protein